MSTVIKQMRVSMIQKEKFCKTKGGEDVKIYVI